VTSCAVASFLEKVLSPGKQMQITRARLAAFDILRRVADEGAYASNLLASEGLSDLGREDRALVQTLVLGVLRWQRQLDFLIEHYSRRGTGALDTAVVLALRLGLYQLRFLERVPAHAAINESVNLTRKHKVASASGFVNGVLRSAQRQMSTPITELIPPGVGDVERLSIETAHPQWLLERWVSRYGASDARALALANNETPQTALRLNLRRASKESIVRWFDENSLAVRDSLLSPDALIQEEGYLSPASKPIREGWVYPQDECSQLVAHLAIDLGGNSESAALKILDLCAAPGSKTSLMESLLPGGGIIACDIHRHRLRTLLKLAQVSGANRILPVQLDATGDLPFAEDSFDAVLLDAPCSGLGTLQRHPEIKWRVTADNISELSHLQRSLIESGAKVLRPGGLLTYSVCTTEPEEGEEIIASFKSAHPEYRDVTRERLVESGLNAGELLTSTYGARSFTHRDKCESFFFCVLWKRK
jgi:16S rRNA (cytosine967-C5)-methyltransferase